MKKYLTVIMSILLGTTVLLVLSMSVSAQKPENTPNNGSSKEKATGGVSYEAAGLDRHISFVARESSGISTAGRLEYTDVNDRFYDVVVSNVNVVGDFAFFAGEVVTASNPAWVGNWISFAVLDEGTPGREGDVVWGVFTDQATAVSNVQDMVTPGASYTVHSGNLVVHSSSQVTVGANLDEYTAPECDFIVDDDPGEEYSTIQDAIDDSATDEKTVCVEDGDYNEFVVDKPVTIAGITNPADGTARVVPSSDTITDLALIESSDVTLTGLHFDGNDTEFDSHQLAGIRISPDGEDLENIHVLYNMVENLNSISATASVKGIQWHDGSSSDFPASGFALRDSSIRHNEISTMLSNKGSYGVQTVGELDDVTISSNTISDVDGSWGAGIAIDSHEVDEATNVDVTLNHIMDEIWPDFGGFSVSVQVEHKVDQTGIQINLNNLEGLAHGGSGTEASGPEVDAENNWWGDNNPIDDIFGPADFIPYETSAFPTN